jgi:alkyldihydroxyacetonephosphate synthase
MRVGLRPFLVRFYDEDEAKHALQDNSFDKGVMFLGFEGLRGVAEAEYQAVMKICTGEGGQKIGPAPVEAWMRRRFDFSTVENLLAEPGGLAETIEIAHFWDSILETYYALKEALVPYADEVLGHFSHVYPQGTSLYVILLGHAEDDEAAEAKILKIWETSMKICLDKGAAISHHHGIGLARAPYIRDDLAAGALVLDKIKAAIDPAGIMNPGKLGLQTESKIQPPYKSSS